MEMDLSPADDGIKKDEKTNEGRMIWLDGLRGLLATLLTYSLSRQAAWIG
jgi:hypothetical protein